MTGPKRGQDVVIFKKNVSVSLNPFAKLLQNRKWSILCFTKLPMPWLAQDIGMIRFGVKKRKKSAVMARLLTILIFQRLATGSVASEVVGRSRGTGSTGSGYKADDAENVEQNWAFMIPKQPDLQ